MDKQRNYYLEALVKKGIALIKLAILEDKVNERLSEIDEIYLDIMKFTEITDSKVSNTTLISIYLNLDYYPFLVDLIC